MSKTISVRIFAFFLAILWLGNFLTIVLTIFALVVNNVAAYPNSSEYPALLCSSRANVTDITGNFSSYDNLGKYKEFRLYINSGPQKHVKARLETIRKCYAEMKIDQEKRENQLGATLDEEAIKNATSELRKINHKTMETSSFDLWEEQWFDKYRLTDKDANLLWGRLGTEIALNYYEQLFKDSNMAY